MCIRDSCTSVDNENDPSLFEQKQKVKIVVSRMTPQSATEATLESGSFEIHYLRKSMAVSYTHLDVYKRQSQHCTN